MILCVFLILFLCKVQTASVTNVLFPHPQYHYVCLLIIVCVSGHHVHSVISESSDQTDIHYGSETFIIKYIIMPMLSCTQNHRKTNKVTKVNLDMQLVLDDIVTTHSLVYVNATWPM